MAASKNSLYYGDNLQVLREYVASNSVDLIYLDPPFNSRQDYNVLFAEKDGTRSASQITAFKDTWEWNAEAARSYEQVVESGGRVAEAMRAFRTLLGGSDMLAYLAMMAPRLVELRRVLKDTGSIYLHCDPTASHYLKLLMDGVFGAEMFHSEIIWKRNSAHSDAKRFGSVHDTIFFYAKGSEPFWKTQYQPYEEAYSEQYYRYKDESGRQFMSGDLGTAGLQGGGYEYEWKGITRVWRVPLKTMERLDAENRVFYTRNGIPRIKRYLDESKGMPAQDVWTDIEALKSWMKERLGYPTQKPEALLERILKACSNEGDVVLDPFCGCGTTVQVAQKLNRRWIGIDITHLAIGLIKKRLADTFGLEIKSTYQLFGEPTDLPGAEQLAKDDRFGFENWALGLVYARKAEVKRGADRGIDGRKIFFDDRSQNAREMLISVKSGHVDVTMIRDLRGAMEREHAEFGIFITLAPPTKPMLREAAEAGVYKSPLGGTPARIQILTIEQLIAGATIDYKELLDLTHRSAPRHRPEPASNFELALEEIKEP